MTHISSISKNAAIDSDTCVNLNQASHRHESHWKRHIDYFQHGVFKWNDVNWFFSPILSTWKNEALTKNTTLWSKSFSSQNMSHQTWHKCKKPNHFIEMIHIERHVMIVFNIVELKNGCFRNWQKLICICELM